MSFGTEETFKSKKAFAAAVAERGADMVRVFDTSAFDNRGTVAVAELAGSSAVIVGPCVYTDRRWYANVKVKSGKIVIV
jgi:hypothetical protein